MDFIATLPSYGTDFCARTVWGWFAHVLGDAEGTSYYKHPIVGTSGSAKPDLTILSRVFHPVVVKCLTTDINDILEVGEERWTIRSGNQEQTIFAPDAEIEEFPFLLQQRLDRERPIRGKVKVQPVVAAPIVARADFVARFGREPKFVLWQQEHTPDFLRQTDPALTADQWKLAKSVMQAAVPLNKSPVVVPKAATTMGDAVKILDAAISVLDIEQEKVATQIPPGAQRIRGLAGTGKTVLLAMKAANIHRQLPDAKVLFTFHTQSLYNQSKTLISKFYRYHSDEDPNWDLLHVRHAWGGRAKAGVYSDLCTRQGQAPLVFDAARTVDPQRPFRACCKHALSKPIAPEYDFILVDEAQDFPTEFFRVLYQLARPSKAIYWAYDELQSLTNIETPDATELFGSNEAGEPLITLEGTYPGGIEKDFVLHRSYRCPLRVLMLAHGVGLGIHGPNGPVQMLGSVDSWRSVGYEVENDRLVNGETAVIRRPPENSPNPIGEIYSGELPLVTGTVFSSRDEELASVAASIVNAIRVEGVLPEHIIVISLDARKVRKYMVDLQARLMNEGIPSTIPGLIDSSSEFAEPGRVTLSTVYRAKGNEAPLVYIVGFESLYNYVDEIENRNIAFTAISRSKGWVRISGIGPQMHRVREELKAIASEVPLFRFTFPDVERIRRLDAEVTRRRREQRKAKQAVQTIAEVDAEALKSLDSTLLEKVVKSLIKGDAFASLDPELRKEIQRRIAATEDENQ